MAHSGIGDAPGGYSSPSDIEEVVQDRYTRFYSATNRICCSQLLRLLLLRLLVLLVEVVVEVVKVVEVVEE